MPNSNEERVKIVTLISSIPPKVTLTDVKSGELLPKSIINAIEEKIASGEISLPQNGKSRISKKQLQAFGISTPYGVIALKNGGDLRILVRYKGEKHGRHLGKGAFGKVKILWDPKTNEYFALKQQKHSDDLAAEIKMLGRVGQLVDSFTYPTSKKWLEKYGPTTNALIMQIAP